MPGSTAEAAQDLRELAADLVEAAIELGIKRIDLLSNTFDQLVERVDVSPVLAHLALHLGLGHGPSGAARSP